MKSIIYALIFLFALTNAWLYSRQAKASSNSNCGSLLFSPARQSSRIIEPLHASLPENYQEVGNSLIRKAGDQVGASSDQLSVKWRPGKVTVTVHGDCFASVEPEEGEEEYIDKSIIGDDEGLLMESQSAAKGVDVTSLARAINSMLDDGDVGLRIAETHEVEVTTPGAPDELQGIMFESYKGFEIIAEFYDPKKDAVKNIDARLVEKNDEYTIINIKGRIKKLKNQDVRSVRLPKAKREKGGS